MINLSKIFCNELDDIFICLNFIQQSIKLKPRLATIVYSYTEEIYEKTLAKEFINSIKPRETNYYNSILILIYGIFEKFNRDLCIKAITKVNNEVKQYSKLNEKIKNRNIILTGRTLFKKEEPLDYFQIDIEKIIKNIGTCLNESKSYCLNVELFGLNHKILNNVNLKELFERIDIDVKWDEIAKKDKFQIFFESKITRNVAKSILLFIDEFVEKRNFIAHSGTSSSNIDAEYLVNLINFLKIYAEYISEYLEKEIKKFF
jgi:hypothetical protein